MFKKITVLFVTFLVSGFAWSSDLSFVESAEEIRAILKDKAVTKLLRGAGEVSSIQREGNTYAIVTSKCGLNVEVRYIGAPMPGGPVKREIIPGRVNCLPGGISGGN